MEGYLLDWANLLLRWLHVIVAIAWIGSSFYFVWLDNSLKPPQDPELKQDGVGGELWAVHGGGFYNPQKYLGAPPRLPEDLHWFYWESYSTWLSGFALFSVLYLFNPKVFLINPDVANLTPEVAVILALSFLAVGWLVYNLLCRMLQKREGLLAVLVVAGSGVHGRSIMDCMPSVPRPRRLPYHRCDDRDDHERQRILPDHPGQRKIIAAMKANQPVDPIHGQRGKQRSVHNTYFTLPVLFTMLSNHYSMTYSHNYNWLVLVLVLIMAAGVLIRQFFILRHKGKVNFTYPTAAAALLAGVVVWLAPAPAKTMVPVKEVADIGQIQQVMQARCVQCHSARPTMMPTAAKGISLESAEDIKAHAQLVYQQAVLQKAMPLGNVTKMTDEERALIAKWYDAGAK